MSSDEEFPFPNHLREEGGMKREEEEKYSVLPLEKFHQLRDNKRMKELQWSYACANHTEGCVQAISISEGHFTFYLSI